MSEKTRILLVRHGRTAWNREERFRGQSDVPLDEVGLEQAETTGRRIAGEWKPSAVYSSPLVRALRTAEIIAAKLGLKAQPHPGLNDIYYGQWQGLSVEEVKTGWPEEFGNWANAPHKVAIPDGESLEGLQARGVRTIRELVETHSGQTIVVVGHTVINRVILLGLLGLGLEKFWRIRQDTCAVSVIDCRDGEFTVVSLNDTCHLRP